MTDVDLSLIEFAAEAAVQRSFARTLVPVIRHAVLVTPDLYGERIHAVQMDGDTFTSPAHDVTTGFPIPVGTRVSIIYAPPHQAMIFGTVTTPSMVVAQQVLTTTGSSLGASGNTDMALTDVPLIGGMLYGFHVHSVVELSSVSADSRWTYHVAVDGTEIGRVGDINPRVTGVSHWLMDALVFYTPDTTNVYDLVVTATLNVAGSSVQLQANGTNGFRHLTVLSYGAPAT